MSSKVLLRAIDKTVKTLESMDVKYAIFGGMALQAWQRLRTTLDIDIMIVIDEISMKDLSERMQKEGFRLEPKNPVVEFGDMTLFRFLYTDKEIFIDVKIDIAVAMSRFSRQVVHNAVRLEIFNKKIRFVRVEDLILLKLLAARPIDIVDAEDVLKINRDSVDINYLKQYAKALRIEKKLDRAFSMIAG